MERRYPRRFFHGAGLSSISGFGVVVVVVVGEFWNRRPRWQHLTDKDKVDITETGREVRSSNRMPSFTKSCDNGK